MTEDDRKLIEIIKAASSEGYIVDEAELARICSENSIRIKELRRNLEEESEYDDDAGEEVDEAGGDDQLGNITEDTVTERAQTLSQSDLDTTTANMVMTETTGLVDKKTGQQKSKKEK